MTASKRIPKKSGTWTRFAPYLLSVLLAAATAAAEKKEAPLTLAGLTLADQHGASHPISVETRTVVFTTGMDASKIVRTLLEERPPDWLARHQAIFVADIHRMPRLITRFIALPRMRRYPYKILLIRDDETAADWPRKEDLVTVLTLTDLRVETVRYTDSAEELESWIRAEARKTAGDEPAAP